MSELTHINCVALTARFPVGKPVVPAGLKGMQFHNQRERKSRTNDDIDHERTRENYDLKNDKNIDYNERVKEIIESQKTGTRKTRKDAVLVNELLVTSDRDFFEQLDQYKKDTVFHKQELQEVKDELQKANKQLQSGIEHMRSTKPFDYENERTGLFSGREETGRKILTADEFERLQETISSAGRRIFSAA